jgi:UrcA family protein
MRKIDRIAMVAAFAAGALMPAAASAEDVGYESARMIVATSDVNLATAEGRAKLVSRINHAAGVVCGDSDSRDLKIAARARDCTANAVKIGMRDLDTAIARANASTQVASLGVPGSASSQ